MPEEAEAVLSANEKWIQEKINLEEALKSFYEAQMLQMREAAIEKKIKEIKEKNGRTLIATDDACYVIIQPKSSQQCLVADLVHLSAIKR